MHENENDDDDGNVTGRDSGDRSPMPRYMDGSGYMRGWQVSKTAITKYEPDPSVKTLSQRLEEERRAEEEQKMKQQETDTFLSKVISYIW